MKLKARLIQFTILIILSSNAFAQTQAQLPGSAIPQFVDALPSIPTLDQTAPLELHMHEFQAQVLSTGTFAPGQKPNTWVWGYVDGPVVPSAPLATYVGPVVIARRGEPTEIKWVNDLGDTANSRVLAYTQSTDQTIHWADPLGAEQNQCADAAMMSMVDAPPVPPCVQHYSGPILASVHLHGGEVPPVIDGGPDSWFNSDGSIVGSAYYSRDGSTPKNYAIYRYPNSGESEPLWFHDHTLGVTRLGVFSGLAGIYLLTDPANDPVGLPPPIPLVIQDRMFDVNGELFFPAGPGSSPNPTHPFWVPEFFGDTILVNGKTWPFLNVEPKRYRFIIVNGSNARAYSMKVSPSNGRAAPSVWQIGTDGGYLDKPVKVGVRGRRDAIDRLLLMPGERADIIVDFSRLRAGNIVLLQNNANAPYPGGDAPDPQTTGRIMQFRVIPLVTPDTSIPITTRTVLRDPMVRLANPRTGTPAEGVQLQRVRQLTLNEIMGMPTTVNGIPYPGGSLGLFLNNTRWSGESSRTYGDFTQVTQGNVTTGYSELPQEGDTELWEIVNLTQDQHPIHLHLVQFQLVNRQRFNGTAYTNAYNASFPGGLYLAGFGPPFDYRAANNPLSGGKDGGNPDITPFLTRFITRPAANEAGWKDTIQVPPGQVTRIIVRWGRTDLPVETPPQSLAYSFDPGANGAGYVWHCHILDHEDNEMMRPFAVTQLANISRAFQLGVDY